MFFFLCVDDMTKLEARRGLNQNDDFPTFSFTIDSDSSPSPGIFLLNRCLSPFYFDGFKLMWVYFFVCLCVGVVRFSSNGIGNDAVPSFSGIADFSPDPEPSGIPFYLCSFIFLLISSKA